MSNCATIKEITEAIQQGGNPEELIPYNAEIDEECYKEILLLYLRYGTNRERLEICKNKFMELEL